LLAERAGLVVWGQLDLRLPIQPDGSVSMCALQSSDMKGARSRRLGLEPRPVGH